MSQSFLDFVFEEVAASRDMTIDALLKFYIGNGLREDRAKLFSDLKSLQEKGDH
jgi:hypothetical protein